MPFYGSFVSSYEAPTSHRSARRGWPTCCPSGLLSFPPLPVLMYGFLLSGWMQLSLRPSIASQTFQYGLAGVDLAGVMTHGSAGSDSATHFLDLVRRSQRLKGKHYNVNDPHDWWFVVVAVCNGMLSLDIKSFTSRRWEVQLCLLIQVKFQLGGGWTTLCHHPPQGDPDGGITANSPGGLSLDCTNTVRSHFSIYPMHCNCFFFLLAKPQAFVTRPPCSSGLGETHAPFPSFEGSGFDSGFLFRSRGSQKNSVQKSMLMSILPCGLPGLTRLFHLPHIIARVHNSRQDTQHSRTEHQRHSSILQIPIVAPPK